MSIKKKLSCGFWNIGIIDNSVFDIIRGNENPPIRWMKHKSLTKFYADPFPIGEDENNYILAAEEYSYISGKGVIVKLYIDKKSFCLVNKELLIETKYHLSFPFPYEGGFVPEQFRSGKLFWYKDGKEICICDYPVIDPIILKRDKELLLFGTMPCNDNKGHSRSLFWFRYDGNKFIPKSDKPIKEDYRTSRAAGCFFSMEGKLYRGAQDCEDLYGGKVRIMEVYLKEDSYIEREVAIVNSTKEKKYNEGLHTFNPWKDIVIIDGFQMEFRPLFKILFVLVRTMRKLICW